MNRRTTVVLYRAAPADGAWFGHRSWWTPEISHAERYRSMPGFGGPTLYRLEVEPDQVLNLGRDPWRALADKFGLDRDDYGQGELDHEIVSSLSQLFAAAGYEWVVLSVAHPDGHHDEWMYVGAEQLRPHR